MPNQRQGGLIFVAALAAVVASAAFAQPYRTHVSEPVVSAAAQAPELKYPTLRRRIHERALQARAATGTAKDPRGVPNGTH